MRLLFLVLMLATASLLRAEDPAPTAGRTDFIFERAGLHIPVRYYVPADATPNFPVVFVMHGVKRNGETYLNEWISYADQYQFLLITPSFPKANFPKPGDTRMATWRRLPASLSLTTSGDTT